jgi:hypothetical protein
MATKQTEELRGALHVCNIKTKFELEKWNLFLLYATIKSNFCISIS